MVVGPPVDARALPRGHAHGDLGFGYAWIGLDKVLGKRNTKFLRRARLVKLFGNVVHLDRHDQPPPGDHSTEMNAQCHTRALCYASAVNAVPYRVLLSIRRGHVCVVSAQECMLHVRFQHRVHIKLNKLVHVPTAPGTAQPNPALAMLVGYELDRRHTGGCWVLGTGYRLWHCRLGEFVDARQKCTWLLIGTPALRTA